SLVARMGIARFQKLDWITLDLMRRSPDDLNNYASALAEADPARAEALLYAWPPEAEVPPGDWAEPFRARWGGIEEEIAELDALGFTSDSDHIELVARAAVRP